MQATRYLVQKFTVDGVALDTSYADLYVVQREGDDHPGPTDWEAQARGTERRRISPGRHHVALHIADGSVYSGEAIVRFTDGRRHLFRGDGDLQGFDDFLP